MGEDEKKVIDVVVPMLRGLQEDQTTIKRDVHEMRLETREGFASIKSHISGLVADVFSHERRLLNLEDELLRLKASLGGKPEPH
jgi:hypothetical protein